MVDAAAASAHDTLVQARRQEDPLARLAAGRIEAARGTVDAWLTRAATVADAAIRPSAAAPTLGALVDGDHSLGAHLACGPRATSVAMRAEIDRAAKAILEAAAAACGSHQFVTAGRLDRARRDLETFLLQHRLDPLLARLGAESLAR